MEIFRCPEFLIISLKRFSHHRSSASFSSRKIEEIIEYPIEGLDISQHTPGFKDNQKFKYDLYAVSNHYGSLNGGHYTAFAKSPINQKWYEYDDNHVNSIDESKIINKAGYVLFYKRRSGQI